MVRDKLDRRKRYVEVLARHLEDGKVLPVSVTWDDGRVFSVDRVCDMRQAASLKVGGMGMRYIVRIGHATTCLFYEDPGWFVEEIVHAGAEGDERDCFDGSSGGFDGLPAPEGWRGSGCGAFG